MADYIRCKLPKSKEFIFGDDVFHCKKDYFTHIKVNPLRNMTWNYICEIAKKAERNIRKQIAQDIYDMTLWKMVSFYDGDMEMDYIENVQKQEIKK